MCSTKTRSKSIPAFFIRLLMVLASVTFSANALADPQIVSPSTGSTLSGPTQKFTWTIDSTDIERVWLYVGRTAGGNDIANSGDLGKDTEYDVIGIPVDGSTVHARLWYYNSSEWAYVDSNYTAADLDILTPSDGSTLTGSAQTFSWNIDGVDVERSWLYVGTTEGGRDIADSGDLGTDSEYYVIGIPVDGSTIYVRYWYYSGSRWSHVDNSYTAADLNVVVSAPTMDSPANNSELAGASVDFKWSDNNTLVNYWWLFLGTAEGEKDIYDSGRALRTQTSVTIDNLPVDGSPVYARLWYRTAADGWKYIDNKYSTGSDPGPDPVDAEVDMARLLMQGSFGATVAEIDNGLDMGGPAEWIDAQMALPAEVHLPIVRQLYPDPNEVGRQRGRYRAFWERTLRAEDQLRQRVAFALSQIFVISDKSGKLTAKGNQVANYYDVLINNSFGNFRQLMEDVTLNTAMGRYLSMLGNDKPDNETGKRADENYARELMQLFTIGLVGLNLDGSEREGEVTYTQDDVANLARVFTGWYWNENEPRWRANTNYRPNDLDALERPMVAFPDHHDTDAKVFMGTVIPAGQTAEQELKIVLDILFNHPNVGPFIGEQLIKRLVTSNPSPGYVRRVASVFNNNGTGVRGDMGAVVKAILLDDEARNQTTRNRTDFGKLREPLLRYAAMWRAFKAAGDMNINIYHPTVIPQIAPLTAPSVFNYYSPSFAPQGAIVDAGLVAPEFQINSEAASNTINSRLMRAVIIEEMHGKDTRLTLDLRLEAQLLESSAAELIDHLDLLLTAGTLTDDSRRILTEYIDSNRESIDADRLLRDVIGLVVTSTEYAIQR